MAQRKRTLALKVESEVTGLDRVNKLGQRLTSVGKDMTKNFTLPLVAAGTVAFKFASDLEEATTKAATVFEDESGRIAAAARNMDDAFSEATFLDTAGTFGALLTQMGLTEEAAADLSIKWLELAQDMASFHNTKPEEALGAIQSALAGEFEPLKRYGVMLNETVVKQKALEMGLYDGVGAIDAQARALVVNAELFEQQSKVVGDFERTADGAANTTRVLLANLEDAAASLGKELLPLGTDLLRMVNDWVKGFKNLNPEVQTLAVQVGALVAVAGPLLILVGNIVRAISTIAPFVGKLSKFAGPIAALGAAAKVASSDFESLEDTLLDVAEGFDPFGNIGAIRNLGESLETGLAEPVHDAAITWAESFAEIQDAAFDGTLNTAAAIADGTAIIGDEMEELADAVSPGQLAESIRAGIGDYNNALEELKEATVTNINDLESRAQIEASLASKTLTDALNSDSTRTRLQALELVNDLVADYELIAPGALDAGELVNPALTDGLYSNLGLVTTAADSIAAEVETPLAGMNAYPWGFQIGDSLARGMWDSMHLISDAAYEMANRVTRSVRIESEPPDPNSPLRGITKWGGNLVKTYADSMLHALPTMSSAAAAAGRAAVFGGSGAMVPAVAGGSVQNITNVYLTVHGALSVDDEDSLRRTVQRAATTW